MSNKRNKNKALLLSLAPEFEFTDNVATDYIRQTDWGNHHLECWIVSTKNCRIGRHFGKALVAENLPAEEMEDCIVACLGSEVGRHHTAKARHRTAKVRLRTTRTTTVRIEGLVHYQGKIQVESR